MPTSRRKAATPSFAAPRNLPTEADPTRQPMPARDPNDPAPVPAPDAPPNGDDDSGPLTPTPASAIPPRKPFDDPHHPGDPSPDHIPPDEPEIDPDEEDDPNEPDPGEPPDEPEQPRTSLPGIPVAAFVSPAGNVRYESRIQILDAWQYAGAMKEAPSWVDRNWIGYASDEDQLRSIPAGPCLRVPSPNGEIAICRVGDFVARQEIRITQDLPGDIRIEVWAQEQFFKLFLPVAEKPFRPFNPPPGPQKTLDLTSNPPH